MPDARISIVIPAFNEARRLGGTLDRVRAYAAERGGIREVIVVDDGSTDGTGGIPQLHAEGAGRVLVLRNDRNRGKGYSVRRGVEAAQGDLVLMCDADLATPIEEVEKLAPWIDRGYDVVIGSRDQPESRLDPPQPLGRRLASWGLRAVRQRLMLPALRDTQCGFKLFTRRAAREAFSRLRDEGWLFDCEVLGIAERLGYRIREVGVVWRDGGDSRVKLWSALWRSIPELLAIRRRLRSVEPAPGESADGFTGRRGENRESAGGC